MTGQDFHDVFPSNPSQWPYGHGQKGLASVIRKNRASLDNVLFFDRLLSDVAQITDNAKLYPPKNKEELRRLYEQIDESETDSLKKTCFYYYILKDFKLDVKFATERAIPEQFCQLISGFYAFDHLQFEEAVQCFCYPNVTPGYTDTILHILLRQSDYPNGADLAVMWIESTKPALDTAEKMSLYMEALLRTNIDAAFKYQRTAPESIRRDLFINLVNAVMNSGPPRKNLQRLLSLPFTAVERDYFVNHLESTESQNGLARDILLMWNIQTARFTAAKEIMKGDGPANEKRRVLREGLEKANLSI